MNRSKRKIIGEETVKIAERGWYELPSGGRVDISDRVSHCLSGTRLYSPQQLDDLLATVAAGEKTTRFEVRNETTLCAAWRHVVDRGEAKTLCLNFASAKQPGGGFLGGSQAQEESLARSSALYASLLTQPSYYDINRANRTSLYTDYMVFSPEVPVFRNDAGDLLDDPYLVGMLTSPAVNAGAVRDNEPDAVSKIRATMETRIAKALALAMHHHYEHLVLGAWGCGVFRNAPEEIAELFVQALTGAGRFANQFTSITFAVLDATDDKNIITPFEQNFGA